MTTHCMIDLETWAKSPTATVVSIGAVKFDPRDPAGPFDNFHVAIDPAAGSKAFRAHFEIDPETILYWMDEKRDLARRHWLDCRKLDLPTMLVGFLDWYGNESLPTWGNGATFDNVILSHALQVCGFERPWSYKHDRCYRTLRAEWPGVRGPTDDDLRELLDLNALPGGNVPHTALFDAQWQAIHLRRIFQHRDEIERAFTDHARPGPAIEQLGLYAQDHVPGLPASGSLDLRPQPLRYGTSLDALHRSIERVDQEDALSGVVTTYVPPREPRTGDMGDMVSRVVEGQMGEAD